MKKLHFPLLPGGACPIILCIGNNHINNMNISIVMIIEYTWIYEIFLSSVQSIYRANTMYSKKANALLCVPCHPFVKSKFPSLYKSFSQIITTLGFYITWWCLILFETLFMRLIFISFFCHGYFFSGNFCRW